MYLLCIFIYENLFTHWSKKDEINIKVNGGLDFAFFFYLNSNLERTKRIVLN